MIWHGDDDGASSVDAGVLQDVPMRRVAEAGGQAVSPCDLDVVGIQIDRHHLLLARVDQAFRNALSGRAETDDQDQIGSNVESCLCPSELAVAAVSSSDIGLSSERAGRYLARKRSSMSSQRAPAQGAAATK